MNWLDATVAAIGAFIVVALGSALVREIVRTMQAMLALNGMTKLEARHGRTAPRGARQRRSPHRGECVDTTRRKQEKPR